MSISIQGIYNFLCKIKNYFKEIKISYIRIRIRNNYLRIFELEFNCHRTDFCNLVLFEASMSKCLTFKLTKLSSTFEITSTRITLFCKIKIYFKEQIDLLTKP